MSEIDGRRANRPLGDRAGQRSTSPTAKPAAATELAAGVGRLGHQPGLDGLRAVAVVAIMVDHAGYLLAPSASRMLDASVPGAGVS